MYVPYISSHFLDQNDTTTMDVRGAMIYDPSINYDVVLEDIPAAAFMNYWAPLFNLNQTFVEDINNRSEKCGYTSFLNDNLVFPPKGLLPTPPNVDYSMEGCSLWNDIYNAVSLVNPCFDIYQIATTCPLLWDVLGFPGSFDYQPEGASIYFNRTDVQKAINAPIQQWEECSEDVLNTDTSTYSGLSVLPKVIEKTNNVIIGHGLLGRCFGSIGYCGNRADKDQISFFSPTAAYSRFRT